MAPIFLSIVGRASPNQRVGPESRRGLWAALAMALLMTAAMGYGCSNDDSPVRTMDVSASEYAIEIDRPTLPARRIEFKATHLGTELHELVILRTDLPPEDLPLTSDNKVDVDADDVEVVGELGRLDPGEIESLTLDLDPGAYVVICNVPNHYERGMRTGVTVE